MASRQKFWTILISGASFKVPACTALDALLYALRNVLWYLRRSSKLEPKCHAP